MKTVLIVDHDRLTLEELSRPLGLYADEVRVLGARHGEQAIKVLTSQPVDILITELVMPVMDGFELIDFVLQKFPGTEIIIQVLLK